VIQQSPLACWSYRTSPHSTDPLAHRHISCPQEYLPLDSFARRDAFRSHVSPAVCSRLTETACVVYCWYSLSAVVDVTAGLPFCLLSSGTCGGGMGKMAQEYQVTSPSTPGGAACPFAAGQTRSSEDCLNDSPCATPVPCNYTWLPDGSCTGRWQTAWVALRIQHCCMFVSAHRLLTTRHVTTQPMN
jgi:hypothetical protein